MSGVLLALIFGLGWLPLYVFRAESVGDALPYYTRSERVAVWCSLIAVTGHVTIACTLLGFSAAVPVWRAILSVSIFAAAIGFWLWGRVLIGPLRTTRLPDQPPHRLRQDGAFGVVRHPLYLGVLIAAAAPWLANGRMINGVTYALCASVVIVRVRQEERRLRIQVGAAYEPYRRSVKQLIPFVW